MHSDLRRLFRRLARTPLFTPAALVGVWHSAPGIGFQVLESSPSTYFTYREEGRVFADLGLQGAARVSGPVTGVPAATPFQAYPVIGG